MDEKKFIVNIADQFEDIDTSNFEMMTNFRENDEYSSLVGMALIAMVDEKYNVTLTGEELRRAKTILELYNIVQAKK